MTRPQQQEADKWTDLCFHPTPSFLVTHFSKATLLQLMRREIWCTSAKVKVLDMFCGDGRLGVSVANIVREQGKKPTQLLLADVSPKSDAKLKSKTQSINCFEHNWIAKHGLVVANPPFLSLNRSLAEDLNLNWVEVTNAGRNLYSLAALKCLDACQAGGLVALIAPFSWMRGNTFQRFREKITELCDCVDVHPFPGKGHFEDVQQEIAFQFFWKKATQSKAPGTINFHGDVTTSLYELNSPALDDFPTRVGALVWNRTTHRFAARSTSTQPTLVIYGGNIQSNKSRLVLDHGRYANRQWMITTPNPTDFFHGPGILLRRTVRGRPAAWQVDAVAVGVGFKAILENHVVSICVPKSWKVQQTKLFCNLFVECVQDIHAPSGSATLNQTEVRAAIIGAKKVLDLIFGHKVDFSSPIKSSRLAGTPLDVAVRVGQFAGRVRKPISIAEMDAAIEVDPTGRMR